MVREFDPNFGYLRTAANKKVLRVTTKLRAQVFTPEKSATPKN